MNEAGQKVLLGLGSMHFKSVTCLAIINLRNVSSRPRQLFASISRVLAYHLLYFKANGRPPICEGESLSKRDSNHGD